MPASNCLKIFSVKIYRIKYDDLINIISCTINDSQSISITYVTAYSLNELYNNSSLINVFNKFDFIHSDGIGVFIASRILYGKNGFRKKITGSDFYPQLIKEGIKRVWKFFLLGDTDETLKKAIDNNPDLKICGFQNGYNYDDEELIAKVNASGSDILIVGLGCPKQEKWIIEKKDKLKVKIILAVGDGIKVFAGTKKRGNKFFQTIGLEWMVRLLNNPLLFWRRYLIGIPLFLYRVIKFKFQR